MRKFLRVLIPVVLVLAILFCLGWYLFIYDREFTRDMLLQSARYFERQGDLQVSSWLYNQAYRQASDNDSVAIELALQYKASGNYTQAEYTLASAIGDGGGIDLYIALCKTYVEQDKLLDAVNMLNNITDESIKSKLSQRRPQAPTPSAEPGFYNHFIPVEFSSDDGTVYLTLEDTCPSVQKDSYSGSVSLPEGESTICALVISEEGLVSPLAVYGYTIGGVVEKVQFVDPAIEAEIRSVLGVSADHVLYTNDLWDILSFQIPETAASYEDLRYLPYLRELTISNGVSGALSQISSLTDLESITISNTSMSSEDLATLFILPQLRYLTLSNCGLSTLSGIENALMLEKLDVSNNALRNITPLSSLINLKELNLSNNALENLTPLTTLSALQALDVSHNAITSLAPVSPLTALQTLNASHNQLTNIDSLAQLRVLTHLNLSNNALTDVSALANCTELTALILSVNQLTDITPLNSLNALREFRFSNNQIVDLPLFQADCALLEIEGENNLVASLEPLSGLKYLNNVFMDYNPDIESVDCLSSCHNLIQVDVYGTKVTDVSALTNMSVVVNFDPTQVETE